MNFLTANRQEVTCPPLHVPFSIFSLNLNQDIFLKKHNYRTTCNLVKKKKSLMNSRNQLI